MFSFGDHFFKCASLGKSMGTVLVGSSFILLTACGGAGGGGGNNEQAAVEAPGAPEAVALSFEQTKFFRFDWVDTEGATHYQLLEDPDGQSGFSPVGEAIPQGAETFNLEVPLFTRTNARYLLQACNQGGCTDGDTLFVDDNLAEGIGYLKASNTGEGDEFGESVSLSQDGSTLAIGAPEEASNATGINGDEEDNSASGSGAAYVFVKVEGIWQQQAYIKASNSDEFDSFGDRLSLSNDGNTLAIGAKDEDGSASGINGDEDDNSLSSAGAVYIFVREGGNWQQQAYIKASTPGAFDDFGEALDLSGDGNTLAVGVQDEDSNSTGINGNESDNSASSAGAVYVFKREGELWQQQAYIKASNTEARDDFGEAVSLSEDGRTLAVTADLEDSNATGIDGDQTDNSASGSGAAYVFVRNGNIWQQQAYIKASNTEGSDDFGEAISLSADGNILAIGAENEDSNARGINGRQDDNSADSSGAVYIFAREGDIWQQGAYLKASNSGNDDGFGTHLSLNDDGNILVVGADAEDSNTIGINGDEADNSAEEAGAVYVFIRDGSIWRQESYIKASNTDASDEFGARVSLSGDGNTLAIASALEDSEATGINGDQGNATDDAGEEIDFFDAGAAYLY